MLNFVLTPAIATWPHQNSFVHVSVFSSNHFTFLLYNSDLSQTVAMPSQLPHYASQLPWSMLPHQPGGEMSGLGL